MVMMKNQPFEQKWSQFWSKMGQNLVKKGVFRGFSPLRTRCNFKIFLIPRLGARELRRAKARHNLKNFLVPSAKPSPFTLPQCREAPLLLSSIYTRRSRKNFYKKSFFVPLHLYGCKKFGMVMIKNDKKTTFWAEMVSIFIKNLPKFDEKGVF